MLLEVKLYFHQIDFLLIDFLILQSVIQSSVALTLVIAAHNQTCAGITLDALKPDR